MYKTFTAEEYLKHFNLPVDYRVKALISYGGWDNENHHSNIVSSLNELGITHSTKNVGEYHGFLKNIIEVSINNNIYWFPIAYGGATLSEYVHLACLFGSSMNIHIGSCGGLYPEMKSLDLVIPTWTFGTESSASMYDRKNIDSRYYPDKVLSMQLWSKIDKIHKVWKGPIISCHAMLGEELEDIQDWSKRGYYGVEMETATVFAVSRHFNKPSASLVYVADNLIKGETVHNESYEKEKDRRSEVRIDVYKTAIMAVLSK